ncbi:MAG: PEP-CTERM sorting domain-containing protein [Isosphaeraceae bacterium]
MLHLIPRAALAFALALAGASAATADIVVSGSFGPNGDLGFANSPTNLSISFGPSGAGSISQMDLFVNAPGRDLGNGVGQSQGLSNAPLPGISGSFSFTRPNANDLLLRYRLTNQTGSTLTGLQVFFYVDPDIGPRFDQDYVTRSGSLAGTPPFPQSFQAGDNQLSSLFTNLLNGALDNTNGATSTSPADVAMALGFQVASLQSGSFVDVTVLLSDAGRSLGGLTLADNNAGAPGTGLTVSATLVAVPEPSSLALALTAALPCGLIAIRRHRKARG